MRAVTKQHEARSSLFQRRINLEMQNVARTRFCERLSTAVAHRCSGTAKNHWEI